MSYDSIERPSKLFLFPIWGLGEIGVFGIWYSPQQVEAIIFATEGNLSSSKITIM